MAQLEIHHINVGQGDSTLIIVRDLVKLGSAIDAAIVKDPTLAPKPIKPEDLLPYAIKKNKDSVALIPPIKLEGTVKTAMLIDAGEFVYGVDVANYIENCGVSGAATQKKFVTVATHFHSDHVYGFRDIFFKNFDDKKKVDKQTLNYPPKIAYDCGDLPKWDKNLTYTIYQSYITELVAKGESARVVIKPHDVISLGNDAVGTAISLKCMASNGVSATNNTNGIKNLIDPKKSPDQNARSVVMILEYGDFRYFLGGDIGGTGDKDGGNWGKNADDRVKKVFSSHPDIETSVTAILPIMYPKDALRAKTQDGHMCCFFANHHGSASSNDVFLVEQVKPKLVTCSAGVRVRFHFHPTQQFFQRVISNAGFSPKWQTPGKKDAAANTVDNTIKGYYMTEVAKNGRYGPGRSKTDFTRTFREDQADGGKILGDIIVRPLGVVTSPNLVNTIKIQVYGTGDLTAASVQSKELRDAYVSNPVNPPYPIGPFEHICDLH